MCHTQTVIQDLKIEVSFNKFNSHTGFFNWLVILVDYCYMVHSCSSCMFYILTTHSLVYKFFWRWLSQTETCRRVYFVIIQFKYLSTVSAFHWNFIIMSLICGMWIVLSLFSLTVPCICVEAFEFFTLVFYTKRWLWLWLELLRKWRVPNMSYSISVESLKNWIHWVMAGIAGFSENVLKQCVFQTHMLLLHATFFLSYKETEIHSICGSENHSSYN